MVAIEASRVPAANDWTLKELRAAWTYVVKFVLSAVRNWYSLSYDLLELA